MATILDLTRAKELSRFIPGLRAHEQEVRLLYAAPRFEQWVVNELPTLASSWNLDLSPAQQLDDFLNHYAIGAVLTYERQFRPIRHVVDGVWELKTADVRVFGWFYRKDLFIALLGDQTWRIKNFKLYSGYAGEVVRFRDELDLDEPRFIPGRDPSDVVSNYIAPP